MESEGEIDVIIITCPACGSKLFREVSPRDSRVKTYYCVKCMELNNQQRTFHLTTVDPEDEAYGLPLQKTRPKDR